MHLKDEFKLILFFLIFFALLGYFIFQSQQQYKEENDEIVKIRINYLYLISFLPLLYLIIILILGSIIYAQKDYPIPPKSNNQLFYIQHSENKNTYVYDAVFDKSGILDKMNPVNVYRILYAENGEKKPLTIIQKKLAYGLIIKNIKKNEFQLSLVSYTKQKLILKLDSHLNPIVETFINNKTIRLNKVFLKKKKGTSGLSVELEYILFYGTDKTGKKVEEKINF